MNTLEVLARKYGLDKIYMHHYIPGYTKLFDMIKENVKHVLEIGIGSVEYGHMHHVLQYGYKTGHSLRCWRDYFIHATIYGIDLFEVPKELMLETRIKTFIANQYSKCDLMNVVNKIGEPIDIIIDDGSHILEHQVFSFKILESYLSDRGIYVIEDVQPPSIAKFQDLTVFDDEYKKYINEKYDIQYFDTRATHKPDDFMVVFSRK